MSRFKGCEWYEEMHESFTDVNWDEEENEDEEEEV